MAVGYSLILTRMASKWVPLEYGYNRKTFQD